MPNNQCEYFFAGDVTLQSGAILPDTKIAYTAQGQLNQRGDNAILITSFFGGTHQHCAYLVGADKAIDPTQYFVVVVNLCGNGTSSSPSDGLGCEFPCLTMADNTHLHYRLLTEKLGVRSLALVTGHSMGALASFHMAALYPDFVVRAAPYCGAARISRHNHVFIEGLRGILTADPAWAAGRYREQPTKGLATMARAWAAWPPSAHFYRHRLYETIGYHSLEDYLQRYWEDTYVAMDANNVLAQFSTWQAADISANERYSGNFEQALAAISAKVFVMPSTSDAYFPVEDSEYEVAHLARGELRPIQSQWGHWAGSGRNPKDTAFINAQIAELLKSS